MLAVTQSNRSVVSLFLPLSHLLCASSKTCSVRERSAVSAFPSLLFLFLLSLVTRQSVSVCLSLLVPASTAAAPCTRFVWPFLQASFSSALIRLTRRSLCYFPIVTYLSLPRLIRAALPEIDSLAPVQLEPMTEAKD